MAYNKRITEDEFLKLRKEKDKLENELYEMKISKSFFFFFFYFLNNF